MKEGTTTQTRSVYIQEISNVGTAIAWHEEVRDRYGIFPEYLKRFSELGARFGDREFNTLDSTIDRKAKKDCQEYANNFDTIKGKDRNGIILTGSVGVGKTHLAASIANQLIRQRVAVFFVNVPDAYDRIRDEMGMKDFTKSTMKTCDLLILDDLGKEKQTEWTNQVLYEVVNTRYENRKPIIVTTNYSAQELNERIDNAVVSRLLEVSAFVNVTGNDHRR